MISHRARKRKTLARHYTPVTGAEKLRTGRTFAECGRGSRVVSYALPLVVVTGDLDHALVTNADKCHRTIVGCRQLMNACKHLQQQSRLRNNRPWTPFPAEVRVFGMSMSRLFERWHVYLHERLANQSHRAVTLKMFRDQIIPVPCSADRPNLQILRAISLQQSNNRTR